ncbi:hypothetical protein Pelo_16480 [Pelomyxa schiedti]|nr:hypothetical protein Pelo_16480 [Pelomyxa schiedti]
MAEFLNWEGVSGSVDAGGAQLISSVMDIIADSMRALLMLLQSSQYADTVTMSADLLCNQQTGMIESYHIVQFVKVLYHILYLVVQESSIHLHHDSSFYISHRPSGYIRMHQKAVT